MMPEHCKCTCESYNKRMTTRPVYTPKLTKPYFKKENVDFDWNAGLSPAQKKKNSQALHEGYRQKHPDAKILEVSTKSDLPEGAALSPFNLSLNIPTLKKSFPVENVYHASKVFSRGGPYYDLLGAAPIDSKRDKRLGNSGELVHFSLEGKQYPTNPDILFYNWLYINALRENPTTAAQIKNFDAFTDIEFNPDQADKRKAAKNTNNQARACAIYSSLEKLGLLKQTENFDDFKNLFLETDITEIKEQKQAAAPVQTLDSMRQAPARRKVFSVGQWIEHPGIGRGEVIRKTKDSYLINFKVSGPRTISREFVETKCKAL